MRMPWEKGPRGAGAGTGAGGADGRDAQGRWAAGGADEGTPIGGNQQRTTVMPGVARPQARPGASSASGQGSRAQGDVRAAAPSYGQAFSQDGDGLILGRYRPIQAAGTGGFATVQVAWDTRIQRKVAIKCLPLAASAPVQETDVMSPEQAGRTSAFAYDAASVPGLEEARTAAMLSDPHIVGVHDFAVQDGMAYLIMEYVDGVSLGRLLREDPDAVTLDVVGAVFQGVSRALEAAHENGVLHLDVKPDNVLVDRKGDVKVADFGLSRLANMAGYAHAAGGTIGYMPPEQMRQEPLDQRTDEWALASMTYEMIAGQNPFRADDVPMALSLVYEAELPLPHLCMPGVDPAVDDVLFYALDPDPSQRYDTVRDLAEVLQPFLGDAKAGKAQLKSAVAMLVGDDAGATEQQSAGQAKPLYTDFDEKKGKVRKTLRRDVVARALERVWAVACAGALGFVGLANDVWVMGASAQAGVAEPAFWGLWVALCALSGFLPQIGLLVAACLLALAVMSHGMVVLAVVVAAAAAVWIATPASEDRGSVAAGTPALLGSFGFAAVSPLLCGWAVRGPKRAAGCAAFACFLSVCLASLGSDLLSSWSAGVYWSGLNAGFQTRFLFMVGRLGTWATLAAWCCSAALMSYGMDRASRASQVVFAVLAGCVVVGGAMLAAWLNSGFMSPIPEQGVLAASIAAAVVGCALPFVPSTREA